MEPRYKHKDGLKTEHVDGGGVGGAVEGCGGRVRDEGVHIARFSSFRFQMASCSRSSGPWDSEFWRCLYI